MRQSGPALGDSFEILHIAPRQGHAAMYGPSCEALARLAAGEINSSDGILGRETCLTVLDGGGDPIELGREVSALIATGLVRAVTGNPVSSDRLSIMRAVAGRVPCLFGYGHDGLAPYQPGTFMIAEHPGALTYHVVRWLYREYGLHRWVLLVSDFGWAWRYAAVLRRLLAPPHVVFAEYAVPIGAADFEPVLGHPMLDLADGLLLVMTSGDAVRFNRAFAATGRAERQVRVGPTFDEDVLLAGGPGANRNVFVASSSLPDRADSRALRDRYGQWYREFPPAVGRFAYGSYLSVHALAALVQAVGSPEVPRIHSALHARSVFEGPPGEFRFWDDQILRPVRIARADGVDLTVLTG
ncbi:ABC transporter substrate-binding protein [Nocardia huaxiensis]|uniref:ABC transporter substrate-binding protein n=1 Tax=Nocardia huaxiensis TaxID=2755382 RepID=A0A7D6VD49_9NOCA|nr:ABC transporter substrate-binding protein [Nocardia huaxiensis]QLY31582.1 ABC transporter substrate-binding protein [Nocardia huaxiensis]UFS95135.1 ABC transporter substrate-binding protein [Nocardia huaxiensis]